MIPWLKRQRPPKGPAAPPHVDLLAVMAAAQGLEAQGISSVEMAYLKDHAPRLRTDKWGQPLPLSTVDQARLDDIFALLVSPLERGEALLHSGRLTPGEVDALATTNPDVLGALVDGARMDMVQHPAPYSPWAEAVLGYLFQKPAAVFLKEGPDAALQPTGQNAKAPGAPPTPVDRLEPAVREQRR